MLRYLAPALILLFACGAAAQTEITTYSTGTGFFINKQGHLLTNAHVVAGCRALRIETPQGRFEATPLLTDSEQDLAVLKTASSSHAVAPLRWNSESLQAGDPVSLLGYPGQLGASGTATFVTSEILDLKGPEGESGVIQLKSAANRGNSGGPVLDSKGHVIAVIAKKLEFVAKDAHGNATGPTVAAVDIAVALSSVRNFLDRAMVPYYQSASEGGGRDEDSIIRNASTFIVPVFCLTSSS
jgi:S1-C subfamily serine protease